MKLTRWFLNVAITITILNSRLWIDSSPALECGPAEDPVLRVPLTDSRPEVDGKLDEPCWKNAAKTGLLKVSGAEPSKSQTAAFILRDVDHLCVGVICAAKDAVECTPPASTAFK